MVAVYEMTAAVHVLAVGAVLLGPVVVAAVKGRAGREAARRVPELEVTR